MSPSKQPDEYVVVGHVCRDVVPATGAIQVGGSAFYSGLQAARLGLRARVVTTGDPDEIAELIAPYAGELRVEVQPAQATTSFEAVGQEGERRLRLLGWAGTIAPPRWPSRGIVHLAPIARETVHLQPPRECFVGLTPQGLIRRWDADGRIRQAALGAAELPDRLDALVVSDSERPACAAALTASLERDAVVAVTHGRTGAEVLGPRAFRAAAPRVVEPLDDLGAGDVFAAAFFAALRAGDEPAAAMQRGQAAAVLKLEGVGPGAVAGAEEIAALAAAESR